MDSENGVFLASHDRGSLKKAVLAATAILGLALTLIVAVLYYNQKPELPAKNLAGVSLDSKCKYNDPDLCKFLRSFKGIDNISAISSSSVAEKKSEVTMKSQGDKTQLTTKVNSEEVSNYIVIAGKGYIKDYKDNKWWKFDVTKEMAGLSKTDWKKEYEDSLSDTKLGYKKVGTEKCGTLECVKYQVTGAESNRYILFDKQNYMLRKNIVDVGGAVTETSFNYNDANIVEPGDTKLAKNQTEIYKSMSGVDIPLQ